MQTFEQAVDKVVNWWAEKSFHTLINQNNGDTSENGGMAFLLMNFVSMKAKEDVTPEKIEKFKSKLKDLILNGDRYCKQSLSVDYHGDAELVEACEYAGLSTHCLPIKTTTWIKIWGDNPTNEVSVSFGYGATPVVI